METPTAITSPATATATATATSTGALVTTPVPWPPIFLFGARPLSLDAEMFSTQLGQNQQDENPNRLRLHCPNGNSSSSGSGGSRTPEEVDADDQCSRASLFPAEVYEVRPPSGDMTTWVGTFLPASKTWRCEAGWGNPYTMAEPMSGRCSSWESAAGASTAAVTSLDQCGVIRQRVPLRITAGEDEDNFGSTPGASLYFDPPNFNSLMTMDMSSLGCSDPTSLVNFAAAATTTSAPSGTGTAAADSVGAASRGERAGSAALVCVALACASVVAGLLPITLY